MDCLLDRDTKPPPFIRLPVQDYIKCAGLIKQNSEAIAVLKTCMSKTSTLWTEVDVLAIAVYKMKTRWRLEAIFTGTRQVLKCMKLLKSQNILDTVAEAIASVVGLDGKMLVPSKQYLQFLLVRMIGVGKLAVRTIDYCEYTQKRLMAKMYVGHMLSSVASYTSFISRIWVLCHTLLVQLEKCFSAVYTLHNLASDADYIWLPDGVSIPEKFPIDVDQLLDMNSQWDQETSIEKTSTSNRTESDLLPGGDAAEADDSDPPVSVSEPIPCASKKSSVLVSEDIGVEISRDAFSSLLSSAANEAGNNTPEVPGDPSKKKRKKRKLKSHDEVLTDINTQVGKGDSLKKKTKKRRRVPGDGEVLKGPEVQDVVDDSPKKKAKKWKHKSEEEEEEVLKDITAQEVKEDTPKRKSEKRKLKSEYEENLADPRESLNNTSSKKMKQKSQVVGTTGYHEEIVPILYSEGNDCDNSVQTTGFTSGKHNKDLSVRTRKKPSVAVSEESLGEALDVKRAM